MNIFGGYFQVDRSGSGEHMQQDVGGFFESTCVNVQKYISGQFGCWAAETRKLIDQQKIPSIQVSSCKRYVLVGYFRLDYRDELGDKLGLRHQDLIKSQDCLLLMLAFEKWGFDFPEHVEGDWAFVLFDELKNELSLFRDPIGASAIFFYQHEGFFYFSIDPRMFNQLSFEKTIDPEQFFKLGLKSGKLDDGKTVIQGLYALKRGEVARVGSTITILKQYPVVSELRSLNFRHDTDYIAFFKSTYAAAVRTRLGQGDVGLFLSAGLDSSMLCYFASRELLTIGRSLKTFTSYPKFIHLFPPEKQDRIREDVPVRRFISQFSNIDARFLDFQDADIANGFFDNEPFQLVRCLVKPNTFWMEGIFSAAKGEGVQTMMVAKMSNYTVSWDAPMLGLFYLSRLQLSALYFFLKELAGDDLIKWMKAIKHELLLPLRREGTLLLRRLRYRLFGFSIVQGLCYMGRFETAGFKRWDLRKQFVPGYASGLNPGTIRKKIFNTTIDQLGIYGILENLKHGMVVVDPTADRRLVSLSFGLPERLFFQQGKRKFLYRSMMTGLIDESIINKRVPFPQAYDIGLRLMESKGIKEQMQNLENDSMAKAVLLTEQSAKDLHMMKKWGIQTAGLLKGGEILRLLSLFELLKKYHLPSKRIKFDL
jgi:asparagine synthase (glutamine-hydrolysing)